jgi:oligopeptide transport system substrate-binding protein
VLWSDGKAVTAQDFVYAWQRILKPATASPYAFFLFDVANALEYNTGKIKDPNQIGIKAPDPLTVEVTLKKPAAYFIYLTAFCATFPMRQDIVERYGDHWTDPGNIVTNGPFLLQTWKHEYKIEVVANPKYYEGEPALKKIKMFMIPEPSTAFGLYENNELDYVDNRSISTSDVDRFRHSKEYMNFPLLRNSYIGFNIKKKPFDNKLVRQAFSMAIDRNVFPEILRRGERPSKTWIPPGMAGYSATSGPDFNPEKAKQLLAEAGYPEGQGFPKVTFLYPNREDTKLVVESVQDQLKKHLGVQIDLVNQEWKVYLASLRKDAPPMFRGSWGADYPDPETFMNIFITHNGNNNTRFSNAKYDALINRASGEQNPKLRANLYEEADTMLCKDEVPIVCTYLATQNVCLKPWVKNMAFNALDLQFFKQVRIEP